MPYYYTGFSYYYIIMPPYHIRKSNTFINLNVNQAKNTINSITSMLRGCLSRRFIVGMTIAGVGGVLLTSKSISK